MPLDSKGNITYKTRRAGEPQYQADPPVCNHCEQQITQENFGWAYFADDGGKTGEVEFIECTSCTPARESGKDLQVFMQRHNLHKTTPEESSHYFQVPETIF